VHERITSAVNRVKFFSDCRSYMMLNGCNIHLAYGLDY
jgi:hypothetical protein